MHDETRLFIDILFVNRIPFLYSILQNIRLITGRVLPNRYTESILKKILLTLETYANNSITIKLMDTNLDFSSIKFQVSISSKTIPFHILDINFKNHLGKRSV